MHSASRLPNFVASRHMFGLFWRQRVLWTVAIVQRVYVSDIPRMCMCTGPCGIPSILATLEGFYSENVQPPHWEGFDSANGQLLHSQGRRASGEEWPLALWCCSSPKYGSAGQNMVGGLSV